MPSGMWWNPSVHDHSTGFHKNTRTSCDLGITEPIFMTRNNKLVGEHKAGLLEVIKWRRKNRCFETCFGSTDGDHF
jgi:hypothetical protein